MENADVNFELSDSVYSFVSNAVLSNESAEEIINNNIIGEKRYKYFIAQSLMGSFSLWSPIKCFSLCIFKNSTG